MPVVRLRYVKRVRSKGRTYWYHRTTGERLPDDHDKRIKRIVEINTGQGPRKRVPRAGSLADIVVQYKSSPGFRNLAPKTRKDYGLYLDIICQDWGPLPVTGLQRKHILALRDRHAGTPSKANKLVTVLRIVLAFAVDREERTDNPARDIKKLKTGTGHSAWPETAIERFLATASAKMVLALKIGLFTGQREGDCLNMSWHDYDGERIYVTQSKTGTKLWIPVHSVLRVALDAQERVSPIILTTETGKPYTGSNFRHHFSKVMKVAGLEGLTFHGLRYTAAARLAEAGCSLKEIASVTGHKSLGMIEKYSRDADQKRLAGAAILRLENAGRTKIGKPRR
jgi:integrase